MYYASDLPQAHWTMFKGVGKLAGQSNPTEVRFGGQFTHLMANYFGQDQYQHAGENRDGQWINETKMPKDRWACFEWMFKGSTNEQRIWVDGVEITRLAIVGQGTDCCQGQPWTAPQYERVELGWEIYSNQDQQISQYDMWLDEVAIDHARIGCAR